MNQPTLVAGLPVSVAKACGLAENNAKCGGLGTTSGADHKELPGHALVLFS